MAARAETACVVLANEGLNASASGGRGGAGAEVRPSGSSLSHAVISVRDSV